VHVTLSHAIRPTFRAKCFDSFGVLRSTSASHRDVARANGVAYRAEGIVVTYDVFELCVARCATGTARPIDFAFRVKCDLVLRFAIRHIWFDHEAPARQSRCL
jgi:hypothetical protein